MSSTGAALSVTEGGVAGSATSDTVSETGGASADGAAVSHSHQARESKQHYHQTETNDQRPQHRALGDALRERKKP